MINIDSVKVLSKDKIIIYYDDDVVIDEFYSDPSNYTVSSEQGALVVSRVIVPKDKDFINYVVIATSPQVEGSSHTVSVGLARDRLGTYTIPAMFSWVYMRTKVDSMISSFPQMYDLSPSTDLRAVTDAIAMSDNVIGGFAGISLGRTGSANNTIYVAGGDLFGYYPNPGVDGLQGRPINNTAPADGNVLTWDAVNGWWIPA